MKTGQEVQATAQTLKVRRLNPAKLDALVKKVCNRTVTQNGKTVKEVYEPTKRPLALGVANGIVFLVDYECIGTVQKASDIRAVFHIDAYKSYKRNKDGSQSFAMFPSFNLEPHREDLTPLLEKKEITLEKHMGERYNYNGRIMSNMAQLLSTINQGA